MLKAYDEKWTDFPYTSMVNMAGSLSGISSPGVSIVRYLQNSPDFTTEKVTNHEVGHAWFNHSIAADSRTAWMCEGLNTFINYVNAEKVGLPEPYEHYTSMQWLANKMKHVPMSTSFGSIPMNDLGRLAYLKPALALLALRNVVMGPERFDDAFRRYMYAWTFRHPSPTEFFRAMNDAAGEDMSWFWRAWFLTDARLDQGWKRWSMPGRNQQTAY